MYQTFVSYFYDRQFLIALFTAVAVAATVISLALPLLDRDRLQSRMKAVAVERDKIRARERARLMAEQNKPKGGVRLAQAKPMVQAIVERFNLRKTFSDDSTTEKLVRAGLRSQGALTSFVFARFVAPFVLFLLALVYLFGIGGPAIPTGPKLSIALLAALLGVYVPNLYIKNLTNKRQLSIRRAWPDALDLSLICVEAGMSIELALKKVAEEIGSQSVPLAEELSLTTAELSFLPDRRQAYENLAARTGLEPVKAVTTALVQSEKYGTPIGQALRVLAQESRDMRMSEAEKKAAALPPKLTVPMIVFFLPVLFAVIMGPAMMQIFGWN